MRKFLFLDVDGVLNSYPELRTNGMDYVCPRKIGLVDAIIRKTGCEVVISSTWRIIHTLDELKTMFADEGMINTTSIIGATPSSKSGRRGEEILSWLSEQEDDYIYAVLDDETSDMPELVEQGVVVKTNMNKGVTDYDARQVIELLTN